MIICFLAKLLVDCDDIKQEVTNQDNRVSYKFEMNA